jgi:predicted ArsR family transcriptional regulator
MTGPVTRPDDTPIDDVEAIALLDESVRRSLYEWVVIQREPVGRDQAAAAVGVSRALAAFHLDRLAAGGLLTTEYRRLTGRSGPGAGRPAKLYARGPRDVSVSLPERQYEVAAAMMADALEEMSDALPPETLASAAHRVGESVGREARSAAGPRPSRERRRAALLGALSARGYEPHDDDGVIRFGNCPFHALVERHRDLVCGMNVALADGLLEGIGEDGASARLDRRPGLCCVAIELA